MEIQKDTFIFTQARLNSQRLPGKMLKPFCGTSLWEIACEKLADIPLPKTKKWVAVYEDQLFDIAKKYPISIYRRSQASANEDKDVALIWEICQHVNFSHYVLFNACLPMLKASTIYGFYSKFQDSPNSPNSMFGVKPIKDYIWSHGGDLIHPPGTTMLNTKEFDEYPERQLFMAAHCLYGGSCKNMNDGIQLGSFKAGDPSLYVIDSKEELFDVDDEQDFNIARAIYKNNQEQAKDKVFSTWTNA